MSRWLHNKIRVFHLVLLICTVTGPVCVFAQDNEKDRLQGEIARLQKAFDYFREERDQLKIELEKENQRNEQLEDRIKRFAEALEKNRRVIAVYKKKLQNLSTTPGELQGQLDKANARIVVLEADRDERQRQIEQLENELTKEQRLRKAQQQMTQEKELSAHDAELRAESLERELKLLQAEEEKLNTEIAMLRAQADKDYSGYLDLEEKIAAYERRIDESERSLQDSRQQVMELKKALADSDAECQKLQKQLQSSGEEYGDRLERAKTALLGMKRLKDENAEQQQRLAALREELDAEQSLRRELSDKARLLEQQNVELESLLETEQARGTRMADDRAQLEKDLAVFEKALEEERARRQVQEDIARKLKSSAGSVDREIDTLRMKLEQAESARDDAESRKEKLRAALEASLRDQRAEKSEVQMLQEEVDRLTERVLAQEAQQVVLSDARDEAERQGELLKKALMRERKLRLDRESISKDLQEMREEREGDLDVLNSRVAKLQRDNNELKAQLSILKDALNSSRSEQNTLSEKLIEAEKREQELQESMASRMDTQAADSQSKMKQELAGLQQKIQSLEQENNRLQQEVDATDKKLGDERKRGYEMAQLNLAGTVDTLNGQIEQLQKELQEQQERLEQERARKEKPKAKQDDGSVRELKKEVRELSRSQSDLQDELRKQKALYAGARDEIVQLQQKNADYEKQFREQQLKMKQLTASVGQGTARPVATGRHPQFGRSGSEVSVQEESAQLTPSSVSEDMVIEETVETKQAEAQSVTSMDLDDFSELEEVLSDVDVAPVATPAAEVSEQKQSAIEEKAFALYSEGDINGARRLLDKVLAADGNRVDALGVRGVIAWQEGDFDSSLRYLEKALALDNRNARAHNYMGIVQNSLGDTARAQKEFRKAIQLDADFDEPLFNLAVILATSDEIQLPEARKYYERALLLGSERNQALEEILYP